MALMVTGAGVLHYFQQIAPVAGSAWYACGSMWQPMAVVVAHLALIISIRILATTYDLADGNMTTFIAACLSLLVLRNDCALLPSMAAPLAVGLCAAMFSTYGVGAVSGALFHVGIGAGVLLLGERWSILLLPWLMVSLWVIRPFNLREMGVLFSGAVLPLIFWFTFILLSGAPFGASVRGLGHMTTDLSDLGIGRSHYLALGLGALAVAGAVITSGTGPVRQRTFISVLLLLLAVTAPMFMVMRGRSVLVAPMLAVPLAVVYARLVKNVGNPWLADALLVLLALVALMPQLA